ncbi:MAG: hypothetical protein JOZ54_04845 [Acidobacteria bacterium]|nr:hypothetical protein [Acidobacteriota bacterium]
MNELQFDRAEYAQPSPSAVTCTACQHTIVDNYYTAYDGSIVCAQCREKQEHQAEGWSGVRMARAFFAGLGVAIAGSIVYWGVRKLTNMEFGLLAIAVGFGVGKAVLWGSRYRGGAAYQTLAILLTYASICANYTPDIIEELMNRNGSQEQTTQVQQQGQQPKAVEANAANAGASLGALTLAFGFVLILSFIAPFMSGFGNVIGILIIFFGLYQAWKVTKKRDWTYGGPFSVTPNSR